VDSPLPKKAKLTKGKSSSNKIFSYQVIMNHFRKNRAKDFSFPVEFPTEVYGMENYSEFITHEMVREVHEHDLLGAAVISVYIR